METEYDDMLANSYSGNYDGDSSEEGDSDEELKEAFAAGLLKPGLNVVGEQGEKKVAKNNVPAMRQKLEEMKSALNWIEHLDLVNKPAPLAPELAYKQDLHVKERTSQLKQDKAGVAIEDDVVHNDFKREMIFYRQAQAAVLEGLPRLHSMKVATKRPEDYFAQMAKSDDHMNKIRAKLLSKEQGQERADKIKKLREMKKYGKKVQIEVQQKRQKEKKDMMDELKKMRKGQESNMEFLEKGPVNKKSEGGGKGAVPGKGAILAKRKGKDKKFGFGGKKRGLKTNDKKSNNDISDFAFNKSGGGGVKGGGRGGKSLGKGAKTRPGKGKRQKIKNKKKK